MNNISLGQIIIKNTTNVLSGKLGNELVMMDIESGNYLNINNVGATIWEMINEPILVEDLLQQLLNRFDVAEEQCKNELFEFLGELNAQKLITLKSG